jgi:outer membrane protein TolC
VIRPTSFVLLFFVSAASAQEAPLTIGRAVELAVERNERAAVAETTVDAAEARVRRGRSFFLPQLDIVGSYRHDDAADTERTLASTALLTQPLFNARAFPLMRQLRLESRATRLSADESKRLLAFDAADAFLIVLGFEQVLSAAEHRRDFARTSLNDTSARFEAGLVSSNDVTRAELELATAVRGVAQAAGDVQNARIQLANLLNADAGGPLQVPEDLLAAAAAAPAIDETTVQEAQTRRTDIAAARVRVEALRAFAEEPSRRFIPDLLLTAQSRNINDGPISDRNNEGAVGVTLNWPVFDAGTRRAEEAERVALTRGAELELDLSLRDVERQIRSAGVLLTTEQAALREAAAALRAARKNADETNELYRQGLASALELADANQRLFEAEVAEVTARFRMAQAYLALREARGVGPV